MECPWEDLRSPRTCRARPKEKKRGGSAAEGTPWAQGGGVREHGASRTKQLVVCKAVDVSKQQAVRPERQRHGVWSGT